MLSVQLVGSVDNQVLLSREYRFVIDAIAFSLRAGDQHARVSHLKYYVIRTVLPVST